MGEGKGKGNGEGEGVGHIAIINVAEERYTPRLTHQPGLIK